MQLCQHVNQTYVLLGRNMDSIVSVREGPILVGFLGKLYDNLLIRKSKRKCSIIETKEYGKKIDKNGTYSGILGLLQNHIASLYMKGEPPFFDQDFIQIDYPITIEQYVVQEQLTPDDGSRNLNNIMDSLRIDTQSSVLIVLFFIVVMIMFDFMSMNSLTKKTGFIIQMKTYCINVIKGQSKLPALHLVYSLSALGIFLMFYDLHLFFVRLIITNNIKTSKVLIDTSSILRDETRILQTKKLACYLESESELKFSIGAPKTSLLRRIYDEKSNLDEPDAKNRTKCIYNTSDFDSNFSFKKKFGVVSHTFAYILHVVFGAAQTDNIIYMNKSPIYESNSYFYIRKGTKYANYYKQIHLSYLETGLLIRLKNLLKNLALDSIYRHGNRIYYSVADYIDDYSYFDSLTFDNFEILFAIYHTICLTLLAIQLTIRSSDKLIKKYL